MSELFQSDKELISSLLIGVDEAEALADALRKLTLLIYLTEPFRV